MASESERLSDAFFVLGSQYFSFGYYFSQYFLLPVPATLLHHGIEMFLKGFLIRCKTPNELKKIGHNLSRLWQAFLDESGYIDIENLKKSISNLNDVESLRYPDNVIDDGYLLSIRKGPIQESLKAPGSEALPAYAVNLDDLEQAVLVIFEACEINPVAYFKNFPIEVLSILHPSFRASDK